MSSTAQSADAGKLMKKNVELEKEVGGLKAAVDGLEKEREKYGVEASEQRTM